jgi:GTP-binding protein HflX
VERSRNGRAAVTANRNGGPPESAGARARQRALCVGALPSDGDLSELAELLRTAGVATVGEVIQRRERPHPNTYLGPGKVAEV